jgi:hypothetical protein
MAELLPTPVLQFIDPNGAPYALGNLATYVPGTSTPKTTWSDSGATPVVASVTVTAPIG